MIQKKFLKYIFIFALTLINAYSLSLNASADTLDYTTGGVDDFSGHPTSPAFQPYGVTVIPIGAPNAGKTYVYNAADRKIYRYDTSGSGIAIDGTFTPFIPNKVLSFGTAYATGAIAVDSNGYIYVPLYLTVSGGGTVNGCTDSKGVSINCNAYYGSIAVYNESGSWLGAIGEENFVNGSISKKSFGVAVKSTSGQNITVYATDNNNNGVYKYVTANGWTSFAESKPITGLTNPYGIALDSQNNILVADANNIKKYASSGSLVATLSTDGSITLLNPVGVAVDNSDNVYIADTGRNRILKASNNLVYQIKSTASLNAPWGIAVGNSGTNSGKIFVADKANNLVKRFTLTVGTDSVPPVRSAGLPTGSLTAGTTSTNISLTTDENATCKYKLGSDDTYANMPNTFTTTGTKSHSSNVTGLTNGSSYTYYVKCQDFATTPNVNTTSFSITFSVSLSSYLSESTYTSSPIQIANTDLGFGTVKYTKCGALACPAGTTLTMKVRSCNDNACNGEDTSKPWSSSPTLESDASLAGNNFTPGDGWVQYQVYMSTTTTNVPSFSNVQITNKSGYSQNWQTLTSSPFDTGNDYTAIGNLQWTGGAAVGGGSSVKFQLRTAPNDDNGTPLNTSDDKPDWNNGSGWCGSSSCNTALGNGSEADGYYYKVNTLNNINSIQKDRLKDRWVQYAVFMQATDGTSSTLPSNVTRTAVTFDYNVPPTVDSVIALQNTTAAGIDAGKIKVDYTMHQPGGIGEESQVRPALFYQPTSLTLSSLTSTTIIINNPNPQVPIPTSGSVMVDDELIDYGGAVNNGDGTSTLTITKRGACFDADTNTNAYCTIETSHAANAQIYFMAKNATGNVNKQESIDLGLTQQGDSAETPRPASSTPYKGGWNNRGGLAFASNTYVEGISSNAVVQLRGIDAGDGSSGLLDLSSSCTGSGISGTYPNCILNGGTTGTGNTYNYTSINIPTGVNLTVSGNKGVIIKSKGDVIIRGTIDLNGSSASAGGIGGSGGGNGGKSDQQLTINGLNGVGIDAIGGNGGAGKIGGGGFFGGGGGGTNEVYGNADSGKGGDYSGGGGGSYGGGNGGGGGGLINLTSAKQILVYGNVIANGGHGSGDGITLKAGGGGGGGRIFMTAASIINTGIISVKGGNGGNSSSSKGGGGGGGVIKINTASGSLNTGSNAPVVSGGTGLNAGGNGIVQYSATPLPLSGTYISYMDSGKTTGNTIGNSIWDTFGYDIGAPSDSNITIKVKGSSSALSNPTFDASSCIVNNASSSSSMKISGNSASNGTSCVSDNSRYLWYEVTFNSSSDRTETPVLKSLNATLSTGPIPKTIIWDAKSEFPSLNGKVWSDFKVLVAANDGNTTGNRIGKSTSSVRVDYEAPNVGTYKPSAAERYFNNTGISFTNSEILSSGKMVFFSGPSDTTANICDFKDPLLSFGAKTDVALNSSNCNVAQTLTNGTNYKMTFDATDQYGNVMPQIVVDKPDRVIYDTMPPTILSISATNPNESYSLGAKIPITLNMSEEVYVTSNIDISIKVGANTRTCRITPFDKSKATQTPICQYTVIAGDDNDKIFAYSIPALAANVIFDRAGNGNLASSEIVLNDNNNIKSDKVIVDTDSEERLKGAVKISGGVIVNDFYLKPGDTCDPANDQCRGSVCTNVLGVNKCELPCGQLTVSSDGITYGTVVGPEGRCWLDRNLGANSSYPTPYPALVTDYSTLLSNNPTLYNFYGSLFQWGRKADNHQKITWSNNMQNAANAPVNVATTGPVNSGTEGVSFITNTTGDNNYDWLNTSVNTLWNGNGNGATWSPAGVTSNPCPAGFHVPTQTEWNTFFTSTPALASCEATSTCLTAAYNTPLKLVAAGYRFRDGLLFYQGSYGYYWSSTPISANAYLLRYNSSTISLTYNLGRVHGFPIRCIKN